MIQQLPDRVVIAPSGFDHVVAEELGARVVEQHDRLFMVRGSEDITFAQNIWLKPQIFKFKSIAEAAEHLRGMQRNWWLHSVSHHRRAQLIADKLPLLKKRPIQFLSPVPSAPLGGWTLLDEETLLFSRECSSPWPDGEIEFVEDKSGPPSRAYLKLWELFTLTGQHPGGDDKVIDLGSSPGGWTWVLDQLGCETLSVDKAPLAAETKFSERVQYLPESAFGLAPEMYRGLTWLFSDVICYPERLLELILKWLPIVPNLVCTIKFQGSTDFAIIREFQRIPGSRLCHLSCNKHELTWWRFQ